MPLKPIYEKAPLKAIDALPLRPGQLTADSALLSTLLQLSAACAGQPAMW